MYDTSPSLEYSHETLHDPTLPQDSAPPQACSDTKERQLCPSKGMHSFVDKLSTNMFRWPILIF